VAGACWAGEYTGWETGACWVFKKAGVDFFTSSGLFSSSPEKEMIFFVNQFAINVYVF
jgi:hypothetical protein